MKIKLIAILFCFLTFEGWAQRCGGEFYFRIYDYKINSLYPSLNDSFLLSKGSAITQYEQLELNNNVTINCIETKGNAGISNVHLFKYSFGSELLLKFSTGCITTLKKLEIKKGKEVMLLNFVDIPEEGAYFMDSLPFVSGELTYNVHNIVFNNKLDYPIDSSFRLHSIIPYNLIKINVPTTNNEYIQYIQEFKNDTLYFYSDSLKTKITAKGKVETIKKFEIRFDELNMKWVKFSKNSFVKTGTWIYYCEHYTLMKIENWRKMTKEERYNYRHSRHTGGEETGF